MDDPSEVKLGSRYFRSQSTYYCPYGSLGGVGPHKTSCGPGTPLTTNSVITRVITVAEDGPGRGVSWCSARNGVTTRSKPSASWAVSPL